MIFGHIVAVLLALAVSLLSWATEDDWLGISFSFLLERPEPWFYLLPLLWLILMVPLYNVREVHHFQKTLRIVITTALICIAVYLLIFFLAPAKTLPRRGVIIFFIAAAIFTLLWQRIFTHFFFVKNAFINTIIVGAGKAGQKIAEIINTTEGVPYHVIGFIDDDPWKIGMEIEGYRVLSGSEDYFKMIETHQVTQVIMAISNHLDDTLFDALTMSEERGFFEIAKRVFDIIGGLVGMVFLAIVTPFVSIATLIDTGRPVFYSQERLGLRGSTFKMLKFRTMVQNAEKDGVARPASEHDSRITRVGSFLRRSHIDEMPQFLNVLRGELSLVGPRAERPQIVKELQREVPFYRARLLVRPGLTGWAQVNQNYAAGTEENTIKLEYDLYYIKHRSLLMDLSVIFHTLKTIFGLKGR